MAIKVRNKFSAGWHEGKFENIYVEEDVTTQFGTQDILHFEIRLSNGNLLCRKYNFSLHPKSNLYSLAQQLFGTVNHDTDFELLLNTSWCFYLAPSPVNATWFNITHIQPLQQQPVAPHEVPQQAASQQALVQQPQVTPFELSPIPPSLTEGMI